MCLEHRDGSMECLHFNHQLLAFPQSTLVATRRGDASQNITNYKCDNNIEITLWSFNLPLNTALCLCLSVCLCLCHSLSLCLPVSLSLSLSLYIYIYIERERERHIYNRRVFIMSCCMMSPHRFFCRSRLRRPLTSAVIILSIQFSSSLYILIT